MFTFLNLSASVQSKWLASGAMTTDALAVL